MKIQGTQNSQDNLEKNTVGGLILRDFKIYYNVAAVKAVKH